MRFLALTCAAALALGGCDDDGMGGDGGADMDSGPGGDTDAGPGGDTDAGPGGDTDAGPGGDTDGGSGGDAGPGGDTDAGPGGIACTPTMPCEGGLICTGGPSCDGAWSCVASGIPCTDDAVEYCGCDGVTFRDSSTCPRRPFARRGACTPADGFNCDRTRVTCRAPEPMCPPGEVAEVRGMCWTFNCVPLTECGCSSAQMCPAPATCDRSTMRCM